MMNANPEAVQPVGVFALAAFRREQPRATQHMIFARPLAVVHLVHHYLGIGAGMPTIYRFSPTLIISINADDHAPPHFHVMGPDVDFTVRIADLQIHAGRANRKVWPQVVAWASDNIDLLERMWSEYNERG